MVILTKYLGLYVFFNIMMTSLIEQLYLKYAFNYKMSSFIKTMYNYINIQ